MNIEKDLHREGLYIEEDSTPEKTALEQEPTWSEIILRKRLCMKRACPLRGALPFARLSLGHGYPWTKTPLKHTSTLNIRLY